MAIHQQQERRIPNGMPTDLARRRHDLLDFVRGQILPCAACRIRELPRRGLDRKGALTGCRHAAALPQRTSTGLTHLTEGKSFRSSEHTAERAQTQAANGNPVAISRSKVS